MIQKLIQHKDKLYLIQLASLQVMINFATNFLIVKKIGFGGELDVYYIALAVFSFLTSSIGWSILSVLTPILIENREKKLEGPMFFNILLITISLTLLALISMFFWSKFLFINYLETVEYSKILIMQSILILSFTFYTINIMFLAILQERDQYIKINSLNLVGAIVGFCVVLFYIDNYGVYAVIYSQLAIQIFLFCSMFIISFSSIKGNIRFEKKYFLLLWNRMKYIFFGSFYYRTDILVSRYIASFLTPGFLSLVGFIEKVYGAIISVLNTSITGPTITKFSNLIKDNNFLQVRNILFNYLKFLFIVDLSILICVYFFGEDLFLYFFSDKINKILLPIVFTVLIFLFAMVVGKTIGQILQQLILSFNLSKEVTIYDSISYTFNIVITVSLTYIYGIYGFLVSILFKEIINNTFKIYLVSKIFKKIRKKEYINE